MKKLQNHFKIAYLGNNQLVAHEFILGIIPIFPKKLRFAPFEADFRHNRGRRGQKINGFRVPRAYYELACSGHPDDRTDGKRRPGRTGPFYRKSDPNPQRNLNGSLSPISPIICRWSTVNTTKSTTHWKTPPTRNPTSAVTNGTTDTQGKKVGVPSPGSGKTRCGLPPEESIMSLEIKI